MELANIEFNFPFTHNPNTEVLPHEHNCYELVYYFEGSGTSNIGSEIIKFGLNSFSVYSPNTSHNEFHSEKTSVFCIGFSISPYCNIKIKTNNYPDDDKSICSIIEKIVQETILHQPHYIDIVNLLLTEFVLKLDRYNNQPGQKYDELYNIKKYINENLSTDLDIETLANLSGYSYHYFRHIFKEQTSISPKQYIINCRIEYAKNLLINSPTSILEITQICGFSCNSQFDVIFRKHIGLSPAQYRKVKKSGI